NRPGKYAGSEVAVTAFGPAEGHRNVDSERHLSIIPFCRMTRALDSASTPSAVSAGNDVRFRRSGTRWFLTLKHDSSHRDHWHGRDQPQWPGEAGVLSRHSRRQERRKAHLALRLL